MLDFLRRSLRALALAALCAGLYGATDCDGNIGDVSTGPVSFRVSVATNFTPADGPSAKPATSADGRYVAFESRALNLTRTEPSFREILVRDRSSQTVRSASRLVFEPNKLGLADCENPAVSGDGTTVVFNSRRNNGGDPMSLGPEPFHELWRYNNDPVNPTVAPFLSVVFPDTRVDGDCLTPSVSADGRVIAFVSFASNLDTTPPYTMGIDAQVFVADFVNGGIRLISHAVGAPGTPCNNDAYNPVVSADGQWIVYLSRATNLVAPATGTHVKVYRTSLDGTVTQLVSRMDGVAGAEADNHCNSPAVSADGNLISFAFQGGNLAPAGSVSGGFPLMVRDLRIPATPTTRQIASDIFLFGIFNPILVGDRSVMSDDGASVVYTGVRGTLDDLQIKVVGTAGGTALASKGIIEPSVTTLEDLFCGPTISGDGRWVFWRSDYSQEVIGDTNALSDIFGYGPLR